MPLTNIERNEFLALTKKIISFVLRYSVSFLCIIAISNCAPQVQLERLEATEPQLEENAIVSYDGHKLSLRKWPAHGPEKAIALGLHGFNDYSNAWEQPANWWASQGITTYAYDQRGFGRDPNAGLWGGDLPMLQDVQAAIQLLRTRHPNIPIFLIGESMGGAIALAAVVQGQYQHPTLNGLILVAPGVWGKETLPWFYRFSAWFAAHTVPGLTLTGSSLRIQASDNIEMLRDLGRDPLVIKKTRVDTVWHLVGMMGRGLDSASEIRIPTLILYGMRDQVIPKNVIDVLQNRMNNQPRVAYYPDGWHMLLRDLQAPVVWQDVANWMTQPERPLSSGYEIERSLPSSSAIRSDAASTK